ncbi:MAG TPA: CAP domain-containing protein [Roseiflexaceae bacterium]|nr:CAP domain-containing protein [Roseiflexaceae bacterium]
MRQFLLAAALLIALLSTSFSSARSASASPLATLSDEALAAHNAVRQRVAHDESQRLGGTVSIPDLTWDPALATLAEDWANQVVGQVRPPHRPGVGENIYVGYSFGVVPLNQSVAAAMQYWAGERQHYNYDTNACAAPPDQECGHYTQIVWSTTTRVGCGRALWSDANKNYVTWVCDFAPAGNNGQRPYSVTAATPGTGMGCTPYNWTRWLWYGSYGEDVVALQLRLGAAGEYVYQTGVFDSTTYQAVRHFQWAHRLQIDGIVGPQTQAALNHFCPKYIKLRRRH